MVMVKVYGDDYDNDNNNDNNDNINDETSMMTKTTKMFIHNKN